MIAMFGHEYYYEEHFEFWFEVLFVLLMDRLKRFKASMKQTGNVLNLVSI